jgi:hypothetical protein
MMGIASSLANPEYDVIVVLRTSVVRNWSLRCEDNAHTLNA